MKIFILLIFILPINLFSQQNYFIKGELYDKSAFENEYLKFKISFTNYTRDTIIIPDSNTALLSRNRYSKSDVGFELKSKASKDADDCFYFITSPIDVPVQKVGPGETKYIFATCPQGCFKKKRKYQIKFFINGVTKGKTSTPLTEIELQSEFLDFKI